MKQIAILLLTAAAAAQTQPARSLVGTVTLLRPETAEVEVRADNGDRLVAKLTTATIAQKIAPGARDLKSAENIKVTDVAVGDRVLVTIEPESSNLRRIVIMPAEDIARRDAADRLDWQKRGVGGIVGAKSGNSITVKTKSMTGDGEAVITVDERTTFKRYAPDSVKFRDAKPSKLSEISPGDQVRARGVKSEDGLKIVAEEVVFGTFLLKAGAVAAVNPESKEIAVKELGTNKTLRVILTADSQIKQMPNLPGGAMRGPGRGGMPNGAAGMPGRGGMMGGPAGGFDINQMLERMPAAKLEDLKPGSTVIISSTKPAKSDQLTAIMVLANADMLLQMASMMSGGDRGPGASAGAGNPSMGGGMVGGDVGGLSGLGLSGMTP